MATNKQKTIKEGAFVDDKSLYGKRTKAAPRPETQIGIDQKDTLLYDIADAGLSSLLDLSSINSFSSTAQSRDQIYTMLDSMCDDSIIASVLETYAEDATETNEAGDIVWVESTDSNAAAYVSYLLDSMRVNKNVFSWVLSLCKYGDLYLRLYRESEYDKDVLSDIRSRKQLNEDIKVNAYAKNDHYVHYIEMVSNPAELFELTRFGKTQGYIEAPIVSTSDFNRSGFTYDNSALTQMYRFKEEDIHIYGPGEFVHATLDNNSSRTPEKVELFLKDDNKSSDSVSTTYSVKRGQSLLYNVFKIWRELSLLESSILLNRVTKSSIVRFIAVEVGDMPKEKVGPQLQYIKTLIEQKAAINTGESLNEYNNPGPVENNVYIPTREGKGAITTSEIGGDVNVGQLSDLDYFQDKLFGALRVPKQFFGVTDDNAGFSGGQSLAIISSRYAKMVKRIQKTICEALTDVVNLMLIDKGLDNYINNFTIKMLAPTTQEEIDRRDNLVGKVQLTGDIMNMLNDIEDPVARLKILKSMLSSYLTNQEVVDVIQDEIDKLEMQVEESVPVKTSDYEEGDMDGAPLDLGAELGLEVPSEEAGEEPLTTETTTEVEKPEESILPTPAELSSETDFTDNTEF